MDPDVCEPRPSGGAPARFGVTPADLQFADRTQMTLHLARTPGLPEWMRPELDARFAKNRLRLARLREAFAEASHALRDLEFVVLKGFTHHWFGIDPEARVQHDIDLLLQPDSLEAATKALEAKVGTDPNANVKLGLIYWANGKGKEAEDAVRKGMMGKVADPEAAKVALGHALMAQGKKADAVAAFDSVARNSKEAPIARLWSIYAKKA